jgi:predicted metalloprotease
MNHHLFKTEWENFAHSSVGSTFVGGLHTVKYGLVIFIFYFNALKWTLIESLSFSHSNSQQQQKKDHKICRDEIKINNEDSHSLTHSLAHTLRCWTFLIKQFEAIIKKKYICVVLYKTLFTIVDDRNSIL